MTETIVTIASCQDSRNEEKFRTLEYEELFENLLVALCVIIAELCGAHSGVVEH